MLEKTPPEGRKIVQEFFKLRLKNASKVKKIIKEEEEKVKA